MSVCTCLGVCPHAQVQAKHAHAHTHGITCNTKMQVARVLEVEELPNSDKLYKLAVDVGGEQRQVCLVIRL